jgi:hypothetical protein
MRIGSSSVLPLLTAIACVVFSVAAAAQICTVPGSHGSIQSAVSDVGCSTVEVDAGLFSESVVVTRSVALVGNAGGGTIIGSVKATGSSVVLDLESVQLGCPSNALFSENGASVNTSGVVISLSGGLTCPIFEDSFEDLGAAFWLDYSSGV